MGRGSGFGHFLDAGHDDWVLCAHLKDVGYCNIGAVLSHIGFDRFHSELLAHRDNAFLQLVALLEAVDLTEFYGFSVVSRQCLPLAELAVHQAGSVAVQEVSVVEFLNFRCEVVVYRVGCTCHTGNSVYVIAACKSAVHDVDHVCRSEELQVQLFLII